ncbi:MAG: PAS domain S-box protein, partial [Candidatus Electrothrix sp. AR4]|nr:PAS domain S-box protein [Candidatus Electrothrix sp. AR4]
MRSHIMIFWLFTLVFFLALIQLSFNLCINRYYQERSRQKVEKGFLCLEQTLKAEKNEQSSDNPADRITQSLLDSIALQSGLEVHFIAGSERLSSGHRPLSLHDIPADLPVLSNRTAHWYGREIFGTENVMYGARISQGEDGYAVILFAQSLEFVQQGISILRNSIIFVFFGFLCLFVPVALLFIHRSITHPVTQLIAAMNAFGWDKSPCLTLRNTAVEFSSLAVAFNRMVDLFQEHDQRVDILSAAVEQSPTAVVITDTEGRIEYVNSKMEQLSGYSAEELAGKQTSIFQSGYTSDEKYDQLWQTVIEGKVWKEELLNKGKDGALLWESVVIAPIFSSDSTISKFIATKEDISEQKRTRELLRKYEQIISATDDLMAFVDGDYMYQAVNNAYLDAFKKTQEEVSGRTVSYLYGAEHFEQVMKEKLDRCLKGEEVHYQTWFDFIGTTRRCMHVSCYPFYTVDDEITGVVLSSHDITGLKLNQELLRESENRYRQTFETNMAVKLIIDPADGRIIEANQAAAVYYGYPVDRLVSMRITDINQLSPDEVRDEMVRAKREERLYFNFRHKLASGAIRDVEVYSGPLQSKGRTLLYSIIHDITERKEAEEKLRESINAQKQAEQQLIAAKEQAEAANYAKSTFLANITHELRTPLNAVLGYTQLLIDDSALTQKQLNSIRTIHTSGEHLLVLINDILDLSKIEEGKMELVIREFKLPCFFTGIVDIFRARTEINELNLIYQSDPSLPTVVLADELRLRQVILNLLSNAVKFTQNGGYCLLKSWTESISEKQALLTVVVEDSGQGIAPEMQHKIFEPFRQTGERLQYSEGSGLGLSISRKLVRLMGGDLRVESPLTRHPRQGEGPGSRFSFTIQIEILENAVAAARETQPLVIGYSTAPRERSPKKLLLVGSKASNRTVLRKVLEPLGFKVNELVDK